MQKIIAGRKLDITYKRIKNVYLRLGYDGVIYINVPLYYSDLSVERLLNDKRAWIDNRIENMKNIKPVIIAHNSVIPVFDKEYELVFMEKESGKSHAEFVENRIVITGKRVNFVKITEHFLSEILLVEAKKRLRYYAIKTGLSYGEVAVKKLKSKWGYCKISDGKIVFSLNLIYKPYDCLDYVAIHELAHTKLRNHDRKFYAFVEKYKPDYKNSIKNLKNLR